jgi:glycosyltransferase involved in cell wall biosynthesis
MDFPVTADTVEVQPTLLAPQYVLMTAAHNEESFIEKTIKSVLAQTVLPKRWVIVSDGSTDGTDEIVDSFANQHRFISFMKLERPAGRDFGSKGIALKEGCKLLEGVSFEFIGNIDADIVVEPTYFDTLIHRFERDTQLGMAAGFVFEEQNGEFRSRPANRVDSIPHGAQLVRRACYEAIGGYSVFRYGGEDWYAQQCAKIKGWHVEAIPGLKIFHARHTGAASGLLRRHFRAGQSDYSFGSDPVFELLKCVLRVPEKPWLLGAMVRFLSFTWCSIRRQERPVSKDFVAFLRGEQRAKVRGFINGTYRRRLARAPSR